MPAVLGWLWLALSNVGGGSSCSDERYAASSRCRPCLAGDGHDDPEASYSELLLGAGNVRDKLLHQEARQRWRNVTTLDIDPRTRPDVEWDLEALPLPFGNDSFAEVHAYQVLEHTGRQGDWRFFFAQFSEFWRILRPGGLLYAGVPSLQSRWLWGDPGHTRAITANGLTFLTQPAYEQQVGKTQMMDYRFWYKADFEIVWLTDNNETLMFGLQAQKPARSGG
jgi:predicted SAM-dependent methyltransferase